jgi:Tol biopolymer transport system component
MEVIMFCPYCGEENETESQFCMFCGKALAGSEEADPPPTPKTERKRTKRDTSKNALLLLIPVALVGVVIIGALVVAGVIFLPNLFSRLAGEQYIYVIQEEGINGSISAIIRTKGNVKSEVELARDWDGYYPINSYDGISRKIFSPDGKQFVMHEKEAFGDLLLFAGDGSIPIYLGKSSPGWKESFSPDGKYFAFTTYEASNREIAAHVYDNKGNPTLVLEGSAFGAFLPNSNKIIALEIDRDETVFTGLILADINRGDTTFLTSFEEMYSSPPRPFVSPDGKTIYFSQGENLMSIPASGGAVNIVYKFSHPNSIAFFGPDKKNLVILDLVQGSNAADLLLLDPQSNRRVRIDRDIVMHSPGRILYGEVSIKFSPDGKYIAYLLRRDGQYDLYVTHIENRQRTLMVSSATWISFEFSPDKKRIAYIEGRNLTRGGSLFIRDFDGGNRLRLDTDVWSFQFDAKGKNLLYFKVNDLSQRRPESEMHRIRVDGKKKTLIKPVEDGVMTFIKYSD